MLKRDGGCLHMLLPEDATRWRRWWLSKIGVWRHRECVRMDNSDLG